MKPQQSKNFERVKADEWIPGVIVDIERDEKRETEFKGEKRVVDSVRFVFSLDGYKFPHKSRWMAFSYHKKAGLFQKYLTSLVENARPYMDFDIEQLKNLKIKTMWSANGEWDNIEMIRPLNGKLAFAASEAPPEEVVEPDQSEDIPF